MATALRKLGYMAELVMPAENRAWFRALVVASLQSQLPVVLLLAKKQKTGAGEVDVGHAITLTGFSEPPRIVEIPFSIPSLAPLRMRSGSLDVVYAHDDNLGPHAHYEFKDGAEADHEGHQKLMLQRGDSRGARPTSWPVDLWHVAAALVPKPSKLRLSISSLLEHIAYVRPALELTLSPMALDYEAYFSTGVRIKQSILGDGLEVTGQASVLFGLSLPRHVGVLAVRSDALHICSFVVDVTEVDRSPGEPRVLALIAPSIPARSQASIGLQAIAGQLRVPFVGTRPS